jgi:hypothetical protein
MKARFQDRRGASKLAAHPERWRYKAMNDDHRDEDSRLLLPRRKLLRPYEKHERDAIKQEEFEQEAREEAEQERLERLEEDKVERELRGIELERARIALERERIEMERERVELEFKRIELEFRRLELRKAQTWS